MTTSNSFAYTIKQQNRPGPTKFNHDPSSGWLFLIMGAAFLFIFTQSFFYSSDPEHKASIASILSNLFASFFFISFGSLSLAIRTRWAFQKRDEAHNALSLDVSRHCRESENIQNVITVSVHPSKNTKGGACIEILSITLNDLFGFQKLKPTQTSAYSSWLKSHRWPTRFFLTFWICPAPFQIAVNPLSAHQKIELMAKTV